ncbi:hypothetical protein COCVIDRAFT_13450 [Bipolaris victoriae FI3]|uniref:Uncharacterized protein n=1 Tax=Bipolaris victoriae (strain FI3) TaxID=930091 RepID=W7EH96_BIPV3|nr:hypothetical protein COCVIDRAFT_13450 [Bipolaris victoriae FI3]
MASCWLWSWPWVRASQWPAWPGSRGVVVSIIGFVVGFPVKFGQAVGDVYYALGRVAAVVVAVVAVVVASASAILPPPLPPFPASSTSSSSSPLIPPDHVQLIQGPHRQRLVVPRVARRRQDHDHDHDHGPAVDHLPLDTAEPEPATMHCRANVDCRMSQLGGRGLSLEFLFLSHGENASSAFPTLAVAALAPLLCCLDTPAQVLPPGCWYASVAQLSTPFKPPAWLSAAAAVCRLSCLVLRDMYHSAFQSSGTWLPLTTPTACSFNMPSWPPLFVLVQTVHRPPVPLTTTATMTGGHAVIGVEDIDAS